MIEQTQPPIIDSTATLNQEILQQAQDYFNMGLTVAPFILVWNEEKQKQDKKPAVSQWLQWKTQHQTTEEFNALQIEKYNMFGVLCGTEITIKGEKVYPAAVDRDIKDPKIPEETIQKSYQSILKMRTTSHEKTRTGGDHLLYFSRKPVKGHKLPNIGMELLGAGNWCVMAPSEGYNVVNDNAIATVNDVEAMFYEALEKTGLYTKKSVNSGVAQASNFKNQKDARPCIIEALKQQLTDGNGHLMRLAIAAEYKRLGYSTNQIIEFFKPQNDFNIERCFEGIESAKPEFAANCQSIAEYGYCLENCTLKNQKSEREQDEKDREESKEKKTGKQPPKEYFLGGISNDGPFEAIYQEDDPAFLIKSKNGFQIQETVMKGQKTFYAPEKKSYPYEAYTYQPTQPVTIQQLYKEVFAEIDQFIDVEPIQKHVIASAILLTYQQRKMQTVPYLFPYGDNESGKTTILNIMNVLSYRPLFGTTIPTADLFGYLRNNDEPGCIFEDEIQGINKDTDKIKIYKSGYKRGEKCLESKPQPPTNTLNTLKLSASKFVAANKYHK